MRAIRSKILLRVTKEHRHGQEHRAAARLDGGPPDIEHVTHRRSADADEQRAIGRQDGGNVADDALALRDLEMRILAGRAADADAVDSCVQHEGDQAIES